MNGRPHAETLATLATALRESGALPRNMEMSQLGPVHMATAFDDPGSEVISESVSVGMDTDSDLAALKALVEFVERRAFSEGAKKGHKACMTARSDGFAAFPLPSKDARVRARENAFNEAVERFAWAQWWDDVKTAYTARPLLHSISDESRAFEALNSLVPMRECIEVVPSLDDQRQVVIYFAFLKGVGVVSGGACGRKSEAGATKLRAISELARHALAIRRMRETGHDPESFYERRLAFFGREQLGEKLVRDRLMAAGSRSIGLPKLALDEPIPHSLESAVVVHRCLFENQPPFVGGELERLCL